MKTTILLAALLVSHFAFVQTFASPPNVVLIMADDFGYECVGANGGTSYQTPVLDQMARDGIRFDHCHAQPLCTPTRVQLMTGISNARNYKDFGVLPRSEMTFGKVFQEAGYATCVAGKWQLGRQRNSPQHFGFDESCVWQQSRGRTDKQGHDTRFANPLLDVNGVPRAFTGGQYGPDVVSDFICDFIGRNQDRPFLVYYPMILTHCPFSPTPDSADWEASSRGSKTYKGDPQYFGDMVAYTDKMVGKINTKLESLGLAENTLVLFLGDNGTDEPIVSVCNEQRVAGAKGETIDTGTHVPLIGTWPSVIAAGQVCDDLIDTTDFFPTIVAAAGVDVPEGLDGRSFLPQLRGEPGNPRPWIHAWYKPRKKSDLAVWVRTKRFKLYRDGEFFDTRRDPLEKHRLDPKQLNNDAAGAYEVLSAELNAGTEKEGSSRN
ncbi:sulfatase-like hydrolase/transferase [Allorhodopirellula solitaria]|uniref:Arylsulfatase n=1 Tax=Allorhodopirellula solitaria TaxID=2527987 RepID=A0A5C5YJY1_9BACT|nr:sulfatase-like hydrolase/transferase [Allorhodopirellula solitaria]TWT75129.1 Arylsulfatase [Allorhodopirellula solitaria]